MDRGTVKTVLDRAGVQEGAVSVALHGWDEGKPDAMIQYRSVGRTDFEVVDPGIINYAKALPLEKALHRTPFSPGLTTAST